MRTRSSSGPARTRGRASWPISERGCPERVYQSHAANAARPSADSPRSDQAAALSRTELDRRLARLPARLRLLLQGSVLRRRPIVLYPDRRRRARRDRTAAGPPSLFSRRSPVRRSPLRLGALRRHARDGPALAGGRHGERGARARPAREGRGMPGSEASSSASKRSTRRTSPSSGSIRTCVATTPQRSNVCTTSA